MARGKSTKLLCSLPDDYSSDLVKRLDKRTKVARAILLRVAGLEEDAGGAEVLSSARRSLIRHAAWLDAIVDSHELRLADGQEVDVGAYTQALNSLIGLFRLLGLERKKHSVGALQERLNKRRQPVTIDSPPTGESAAA